MKIPPEALTAGHVGIEPEFPRTGQEIGSDRYMQAYAIKCADMQKLCMKYAKNIQLYALNMVFQKPYTLNSKPETLNTNSP